MKKVAILYSKYTTVIDAIKYQLQNAEVVCLNEPEKDMEKYDLIITVNYKGKCNFKAIGCHHSLLPAFDCEEPLKEALLNGVKITGITIFETNTKKIITQYPIFISNEAHYDEIKQEMDYLEQTIYPLVAEKILNNEQFNIKNLLNGSCSNGCGGCQKCSH